MLRYSIILLIGIFIACNSNKNDKDVNKKVDPDSECSQKLEAAKAFYPFKKWKERYNDGLEQYTESNCLKAQSAFDILISRLQKDCETANEKDKIQFFKTAVIYLNNLNDKNEGALIETEEREELCELFDRIAIAAGINPKNYGSGEGIASEWRDW